MIWLSGAHINLVLQGGLRPDLGVMGQPRSFWPPQAARVLALGVPFALDNGAYRAFDEARWLAWLERMPHGAAARALFAVVPDVVHWDSGAPVGDPEATFARFWTYAPALRALRFRLAYVSQDGCTDDLVPWDDIDCLFVGGSDAWKFSAQSLSLVREAQRRGLWTHMGRCQARLSIGGRIGAAHALDVDSADGTVLAKDPSRLARVVRGLDALNAQQPLRLDAV